MASVSWENNADGLWSVAANWSDDAVPGAADQVTISVSNAHTITYASGTGTISTLYTSGLATLAFTGGALNITGSSDFYGAVTQSGGTLSLGPDTYIGNTYTQSGGMVTAAAGVVRFDGTGNSFAGTLKGTGVNFESGTDLLAAGSVISVAEMEITGATVTLGQNQVVARTFIMTAGTLALGGKTLSLGGPVALDGGATTGAGTLAVAGTTTALSFYLTGSNVLFNTGVLNDSGYIYVGYYGTDTAQLQNQAAGTLNLLANGMLYGVTGAKLANAGTLAKTSGSGVSNVNIATTSTGIVKIAAGTLAFNGAGDSFAGSITGAGTVAFNGGTDMLSNGLSLTANDVLLGGATVTEGGNMIYAGHLTQTGGTFALGGHALTESGAVVLDGGYILGSGSATLSGTTEFAGTYLSGSVGLVNTGTATQTAYFYDGSSPTDTTKITNNAGATYTIAGNYAMYGATGASFIDSGTIVKSAGSGIATIAVDTSTYASGTITISQGTLRFSGATNSFSNSFTGPGTLELSAGADRIATGALQVGQILLDGATATMAVNANYYSGQYTQTAGTLALAGHSLGINLAALDGGAVTGSGTLTVSKGVVLAGTAFEGSTVLSNVAGTLTVAANSYIGYNASDTAQLVNKAGAVLSFVDDASLYSNGVATLTNAGTLLKANGNGISLIQGGLTSTGTINVTTGTLRLSGANSLGGTLTGAGTLELDGGTDAIASTAPVTFGHLLLDGANVTLGAATSYAGQFQETTGTLALGGNTLTLGGPATFEGGAVTGSGTIAASGTTTAYSLALEGTTVFSNSGSVAVTGNLYDGYNNSDTATFSNLAAGIVTMTTGAQIITGGASLFSNAGTLTKSGTGTAYFAAPLTNTGQIQITQGNLRLTGSSDTLGGTISGAGTLELTGGAVALNVATLALGGLLMDGANVTLGANLSTAAAVSQTAGSLALGGHTLTLSGTTSLDGGDATGTGKIAVSGTTEAYNYYLEGSTNLANSGSLTVAGNTGLNAGYNSSDSATLSNLAGGTIALLGGARIGNGGAGKFANAGTLVAEGSGIKYISPATVNTGKIEVSAGTLTFQGTVGGAGGFTLGIGTELAFAAAVTGGATVTLGADSTLQLSTTAGFADVIGGFASGDLIDLEGFGFNASSPPTLSFSTTTDKLTVTQGSSSFILTFSGTHAATDFVAIDDNGIVGITHS